MLYPNFVENGKFYSLDNSRSELDQIVSLSNNLKELHHITSLGYDSFDELILKYLKTGLQIFGLKIGIVSKIIDKDYIICNAITPDGSINKDDIFILKDTYCHQVYLTREVLGFPHVGGMEDMKDHPVYQNMQLEAYISAPIYLDNELFGTLNFSSVEARQNGFSEHERDLISLMANSIGNFLKLDSREKQLIKANDRLKRLVGHVVHDLRNPIGSIVNFAQLIDVNEPDLPAIGHHIETQASKSLEMIRTILEMAAIGTGKVELKRQEFDFTKLIRSTIDQYSTMLNQKRLSILSDVDEDIIIDADENRMIQVIDNLVTNAIKYSLPGKSINLQCSARKDCIDFSLTNEMKLNDQAEFDVDKHVGFGQEIVRGILQLHGSKLELSAKGNLYNAKFSLPIGVIE
ncbi:MAG: GAF domain-containing sensor histidine kinase [Cyclobacteriaceae bacterium]